MEVCDGGVTGNGGRGGDTWCVATDSTIGIADRARDERIGCAMDGSGRFGIRGDTKLISEIRAIGRSIPVPTDHPLPTLATQRHQFSEVP